MGIKQKIEKWAGEVLGEKTHFTLVHPKEIKNGDFTIIINDERAKDCFDELEKNKITEIENLVFVSPRFINIFLSKDFFATSIDEINKNQENFGKTDILEDKKIIIEHTQPNPFKEFHIGHLMNNAIGESVSRILKFNGADVKVCSYHGDVGLHIAMAIYGLRKQYSGVKFWQDLDKEIKKGNNIDLVFPNNKENRDYLNKSYANGRKYYDTDESAKEEIKNINKEIYDKSDRWINFLYDGGKELSLKQFNDLYLKLDSFFDEHFFESQSGEIGKKIVEENIGKVFEESDGAIVFRGENFEPKTHTRVFLNSEKLPTYEAKEIGLAKIKKEKFGDYNQSITITANEQDAFFGVVEVAIGKIFSDLQGKLKHLSHGMLRLPTGKMSSRTGDVITAENLIEEVKNKVKEKIAERGFDEEQKEHIAEIVAIGAIKYSILRQAIGGDIIFDFEKSISFEGDSGPYLQYTAVRAKSVLEKANPAKNIFSKKPSDLLALLGQTFFSKSFLQDKITRPKDFEITEIEKLLYRFPEIVERAGGEYAPHCLVTYLTEVASSFNSFYAGTKIIDENDPNSPYKILITNAVYNVLKNGLKLLGIRVPERM